MRCELYNDNFQNFKRYNIPKAQLVIADIPYNIGVNAYASSPEWYVNGDINNGESNKAKSTFFRTDINFNIAEYFHFCNRMLNKKGAPCMIMFCSFEQMHTVISYGRRYGFMKNIPLFFIKNYSPQVLKANMRIVGAMEYAVLLYHDKLPKFNNHKKMIFNWQQWVKDGKDIPKIHPTQKPINVLKPLIDLFTDEGDVVIDPVAGSGTTLRAAKELNRDSYGFEVSREFYNFAIKQMLHPENEQYRLF